MDRGNYAERRGRLVMRDHGGLKKFIDLPLDVFLEVGGLPSFFVNI
jgi:hypothetical protein